ncbi:MAG: hypothetical protein Q8O40_09875 [Chloroflexota bacterium]|nr:hypothetical protein [Chloroflexota bacterium]
MSNRGTSPRAEGQGEGGRPHLAGGALRCPDYYKSIPHHDVWNRGIFAHTSPIYVACGGDWLMFDRSAAQCMLTLIDDSLTYMARPRRTIATGPSLTTTVRTTTWPTSSARSWTPRS